MARNTNMNLYYWVALQTILATAIAANTWGGDGKAPEGTGDKVDTIVLEHKRPSDGDVQARILHWDARFAREFVGGNGGQWAVTSAINARDGARISDVVMVTKLPESMGGERADDPLKVRHYHPVREEFFLPVEGRARAVVNGKETIIEPGMVILIPAGVVHDLHLRAVPLDDKIFRMLEIGAPHGADPKEDVWLTEEDEQNAIRLARTAKPPLPGF